MAAKSWLVAIGAIGLSACAPKLAREIVHPHYETRTGTLWFVEKDSQDSTDDVLRVTLCHREATPACIRVVPQDVRDNRDYVQWIESIPKAVRALAASAGTVAAAPATQEQPPL